MNKKGGFTERGGAICNNYQSYIFLYKNIVHLIMIYVFVNPIDPEVCENFLNLGLHIIITKRLNLKKNK